MTNAVDNISSSPPRSGSHHSRNRSLSEAVLAPHATIADDTPTGTGTSTANDNANKQYDDVSIDPLVEHHEAHALIGAAFHNQNNIDKQPTLAT